MNSTLLRATIRSLLLWTWLLAGCDTSAPADGSGSGEPDPTVYAADLTTLDDLPLLRLGTAPDINLDEYTPAEISLSGRSYAAAQAKYRGATSSTYPKKSFTLKFAQGDALDDEATGFTGTRKVVLISSFDDNAFVRQALAFELWNRIDPEHVQVRTAFVSVVVNEQYEGVYLMADHIDGHLMEDLGFWEDGNLYKGRNHSADFRLTTSAGKDKSPHSGFTKEEGFPEQGEDGAFADLDAFAAWLAQADDAALTRELGTYIDVRDYGDWWILTTLIDAADSVDKNSYHYRDPRPAAAPNIFRCLPWDFNASFGQNWQTARTAATSSLQHYETPNEVFERLTGSDYFAPQLRARYRALMTGALELSRVQGWLDETRARIAEAALHDQTRWSDEYHEFFAGSRSGFTDYAAENAYIDRWIVDRWQYVASQLASP